MNCLMNTPSEMTEIPHGISYGLKGSWNDTDCSDTMDTLVADGIVVYTSILGMASNLIQPYYDISTFMISASNSMVACSFTSQMAQMSVRTTTSSGMGDLIYTLVNFP